MRAHTSGSTHVHVFDTLSDMLSTAALPVHACQSTGLVASLRERAEGDKWTYGEFRNAATYTRTLREGWTSAVQRIDALAPRISGRIATPLDVRRKVRRGPSGDEYDIHAALGGAFDKAWSARRRTVARAPAPIRVICNVVYNSGAGSDDFFWRGAVAISLVRALRAKGYRTAISGYGVLSRPFGSRGTGDYAARFDALRYGEGIDTARIASILCTPATLRHVLFRTALQCPREVSSGYGYVQNDANFAQSIVTHGAFPASAEERLIIPDLSNERAAGEWLAKVSAQFA